MTACPCCGQEFQPTFDHPLSVDGDRAYRNGRTAILTRTQSMILQMLAKAGNRGVNYEAICDAVYFMKEGPEMELRSLRVTVSRLRRLVAPLGLLIENVYGVGWRLSMAKEAEAK